MIKTSKVSQLLKFIHLAEKLKTNKRRSRTSTNDSESIADHCWRMSLLVLICHGYLDDSSVSLEKSLRLAIVHDLVEAITGDIPSCETETNLVLRRKKIEKELLAMKELTGLLPDDLAIELAQLWKEFEFGASNESKFVRAIDRIEGQIQFNESNFEYWNEHDIANANTRLNTVCAFDSFLAEFGNHIQKESTDKISRHNLA